MLGDFLSNEEFGVEELIEALSKASSLSVSAGGISEVGAALDQASLYQVGL